MRVYFLIDGREYRAEQHDIHTEDGGSVCAVSVPIPPGATSVRVTKEEPPEIVGVTFHSERKEREADK